MLQTILDKIELGDFYRRVKSILPQADINIGLILSTFFINLLALVFPILLLVVYDRIIPRNSTNTLIIMGLGVFSALILEGILRIARNWISAWSDARFEYFTTAEAFQKLLNSKIVEFEKFGPAHYLERLNAVYALKNFFGGQAIQIIIDIPFVLIYIALIFFLAGPLVLIPIIMLVLFGWATYHISQKISSEIKQRYQADDRRISFVINSLTGIHTIKSMAIENPMIRRYERLQDTSTNASYHVSLTGSIATIIANSATQLTTTLVIGIGAYWVISHHLSIGGLAACILLAGRTLQPIGRMIDVLSRLESIRLAEERIQEINQIPQENKDLPRLKLTIEGNIELKDISFRYKPDSPFILENLNLKVKPKEVIGIKGTNFSGKSSLLWLIVGLIQPEEGEVRIDKQSVALFNRDSVCEQIAYLPQKGTVFNGSILENLTMFRPELSAKAKEVSEELGLADEVRKLPFGYETAIGKFAFEHISPGLLQRITLARAFVDDPKIVLFDEANRYVDMETDDAFRNMLAAYRGRATMLIVSNRPSLLNLADRLYIIENKKLKEENI